MKKKKTAGVFLLTVGVVVLLVSFTADSIGLGGSPGLGYRQIVGIAGGAVVAIAGLVLLLNQKSSA